MTVPQNLIEALKQARQNAADANAMVGLLELQVKEAEAEAAKKKAEEGPSFDELMHLVLKEDYGYLDGDLGDVLMDYVKLKTGYSHGSDYYDDGMYTSGSNSDSEDFDYTGEMSDAKEQFAERATSAISKAGGDLVKIRGFDKVYQTLKDAGYKKSEYELAKEICKSSRVVSVYSSYATEYHG